MKLTSFKNPLSGDKGSLTDLGGLWESILGVVVLFFVFAMGQNIAGQVTKRVPILDTQIDPIVKTPVQTDNTPKMRVI